MARKKSPIEPAGPARAEKPRATQPGLSVLLEKLQKDYPGVRASLAQDTPPVPWAVRRRPFGLAQLDAGCNGGIPPGGTTQIIGDPSSGKTTLLNTAIRMNQQLYGEESRVFIGTLEQPYDKLRAQALGVAVAMSNQELAEYEAAIGIGLTDEEKERKQRRIGDFLIIEPHISPKAKKKGRGDEQGDTTELSGMQGVMDSVLGCVAANEFQLGGVDSLGVVMNEAEARGSVGDKHYSGAALMNTTFVKQFCASLFLVYDGDRRNETALVLLNQVRDDVSGGKVAVYGGKKPIKQQGGNALLHNHLLNIELWKGSREKASILGFRGEKIDSEAIGHYVNWRVLKSKCGREGYRGEFLLYWDDPRFSVLPGPDIGRDLAFLGLETGLVVNRKNSWFWLTDHRDPDSAPLFSAGSIRRFADEIMSREDFFDLYRKAMFTRKIAVRYR